MTRSSLFCLPSRSGIAILALAASVSAALVAGALTPARSEVTIAAECAHADLRGLTWIEERGTENRTPGLHLYSAFAALIEARKLCVAGRTAEGIAAYNAIGVAYAAATMREPQRD